MKAVYVKNEKKEKGLPFSELTKQEKVDFIDPEILPLILAVNAIEGIETRFSCSGHKYLDNGYFAYNAASEAALKELLILLPTDMHIRVTVGNVEHIVETSKTLWYYPECNTDIMYAFNFRFNDIVIQHRFCLELAQSISDRKPCKINLTQLTEI